MRTQEIKVYSFNELNQEAQEKALNYFRERDYFDNWHEFIYEEAKELGFKIKSFDLGRRRDIEIEFIDSAAEIANRIRLEHGEKCETYKTADEFLTNYDNLVAKYSETGHGEMVAEGKEEDFDEEADELEEEFKENLGQNYWILLNNEYEHINSDEYLKDFILENDYEFTEDGSIF